MLLIRQTNVINIGNNNSTSNVPVKILQKEKKKLSIMTLELKQDDVAMEDSEKVSDQDIKPFSTKTFHLRKGEDSKSKPIPNSIKKKRATKT